MGFFTLNLFLCFTFFPLISFVRIIFVFILTFLFQNRHICFLLFFFLRFFFCHNYHPLKLDIILPIKLAVVFTDAMTREYSILVGPITPIFPQALSSILYVAKTILHFFISSISFS